MQLMPPAAGALVIFWVGRYILGLASDPWQRTALGVLGQPVRVPSYRHYQQDVAGHAVRC